MLQLLETVIKNCGDIVHMHVAEKDILHEMVKIVKKKVLFFFKFRYFLVYYLLLAADHISDYFSYSNLTFM